MKPTYNLIAGNSVERLAALSDGVFAVALTLLVLDIKAPPAETIHSEKELYRALIALAPRMGMWAMSFLTLGIFWVGQQTQLNHLSRSNRSLTWNHLVFLFFVSTMPFSTMLLAQFITYRAALVVYWLNILALGIALYSSWKCAAGYGLVKPDLPPEFSKAIERRILIAQGLYAIGAALCLADTLWSITFILLVQLNYAIAPQWPRKTPRKTKEARIV